MQFFKAATLLSLGLICQSSAIPVAERQGGTIAIFQNNVNLVGTAVQTNLQEVTNAIFNSLGAQGPVIAAINSDVTAVTAELLTAAQVIANTTITLGTTLTAPEIAALTATIITAQTLALTYQTLLIALTAALTTASQAAVQAEIDAAIAAFTPFTAPLLTYAGNVQATTDVASGVALVALQAAAGSLAATVGALTGF